MLGDSPSVDPAMFHGSLNKGQPIKGSLDLDFFLRLSAGERMYINFHVCFGVMGYA